MNFRTFYGCRKHLKKVEKRYNVHIIRIPGNYRADKIAGGGTNIELSGKFLSIAVPLKACNLMIDVEIK